MSGSTEQRAKAQELLHRAVSVRNKKQAALIGSEADLLLDELRSAGYRELPDGRWMNPLGQIVSRG